MLINVSSKFIKEYRKLPARVKKKAKEKENIFCLNCFDPRLKTHKLSGNQKQCCAFWIDDYYRIKFIFLSQEEVLFLTIGSHDIYKKN